MRLAGHRARRTARGPWLDPAAGLGGVADLPHPGQPGQRRLEGAARRQPAGPDHSAQVDGHVGGQVLDGEHRTEVVRDRVEAAAVHEPRAVEGRGGVVGDVHPVDELALPGDVAVVGAGVGTGADERFAAADVGADGGGHDLGPGREVGQPDRVGRVGDDELDVGHVGPALREVVADPGELVEAATGQRPAQAVGSLAGQVLRGQATGEAGRPEQHQVELAVVGHPCIVAAQAHAGNRGPRPRVVRRCTHSNEPDSPP